MPKIMWKSLHLCFPTNLTKCYTSPCLPPSSSAAATAEDPSRPSFVLINNFNLLYHNNDINIPSSSSTTTTTPPATFSSTSTSSYESEHYYDISPDSPPPDFSAAFASRRFFFSSPGRSNAITDSPETKSRELVSDYTITTTKEKSSNVNTTRLLSGGTVVKQQVYSPDPLTDFRRSMQEMIDAAIISGDLNDGYDFLNELLLSYLSLNPVDTHKFIIGAFSDILVSLLSEQHPVC